ncbi:odorant receptor 131-2-like [Cyclopterus lumpus]|uniref:odorant receptor 131-2-like n=1 Tax=Cyclopterus lumpus TaxID=8103 RepID=UPI0014866D97|nr:odorant receptor 131-2-like [Cyclopterus lumpus]
MLNSSSSVSAALLANGSSALTAKDSFSNALTKNTVAMLVWLLLSVSNGSMVLTFLRHSLFYENPRYIMFVSMVINDALQLSLVTALYVVSYIFRKIHASVCCILIMTAVLTTRSTPLILAGMALERYVSICFPLHYSHMCTVPRTFLLIGIILFLTAAPPVTDLLITAVHQPRSFFHTNIFCDHPLLFRHRSIYYKNCVFDGVYLSFVVLTLLYTYCRIMLTASAASTGLASAQRARNTVLLHGVQLLLCMLTFVVPSLQAALISLFPRFSLEIRYVFFVLVYIIPRFMSPIIYGFRDELFRKYWTRYLACRGQRTVREDRVCSVSGLGSPLRVQDYRSPRVSPPGLGGQGLLGLGSRVFSPGSGLQDYRSPRVSPPGSGGQGLLGLGSRVFSPGSGLQVSSRLPSGFRRNS